MARGRKPKPTTLKILQGNPGKRGLNKEEPSFECGPPEKPDWLDPIASERWDWLIEKLIPKRVLTIADQGILLLASTAYSRYRMFNQYVMVNGAHYTGTTANGDEIHRAWPENGQCNQAFRQLALAEAELGMTPTARTKVKRIPESQAGGVKKLLG